MGEVDGNGDLGADGLGEKKNGGEVERVDARVEVLSVLCMLHYK
jgi:hypothetical protein